MATNERIVWVDYMKAFSIMAVMLYHTNIMPEIKSIAYILCLPAFFFTSGMFANTRTSPWEFFRQRTLRLLIPYVVFGILSWTAWLFIGRKYGADTDVEITWWQPLVGLLGGQVEILTPNPPLWFLCCLICLEWIYYLVSHITQQNIRWIIACLISASGCALGYLGIVGYWEITAAMLVLPLYMLGVEYQRHIAEKKWSPRLLAALGILAVGGILLGYMYNPNMHISTCQTGNPVFFYITLLAVTSLWLVIAKLIHSIGHLRVLQFFGKNTLIILCTHIPLFGLIKGICMISHVPLSFFDTNIGSITLWVCSLLMVVPVIYAINRFFPWAIGRRPNP